MPHEKLKSQLKKLLLPCSSENIDKHIREATNKTKTYEEFLSGILDEEIAGRKERRIKRRLKSSTLKVEKTIDNFDFNFPAKINKQLVKSLFELSFIKEKTNVILLGPSGVGKTHISSALTYHACINDYKCRFTTAVNLINELNSSISDNSLLRRMNNLIGLDLLVIDELGYLPVDKQGTDLLFQIISNRYETGSVIITTNKPFKQWNEIFNGDVSLASAVIDRLVHHCEVIIIEGKSYRVKENK
jgi:DNA replication protein DnaC